MVGAPTVRPALVPEQVLSRLEWRVIRRLDGRLAGDYRSLLRGSGIDVADLREYQPDDDLRHIDWNVTARTDIPHVRQYVEEREVTAWLLLDRSPSMGFGPIDRSKRAVLTDVAATLAQLLVRGGNRVGALLFDTAVERTVPPGQGRTQVLRILTHLLREPEPASAHGPITGTTMSFRSGKRTGLTFRRPRAEPPAGSTTDLAVPLLAALGIARRRSLIVVVSDFLSRPGWERPLALLARRHDVLAVQVADRREFDLPAVGMIYVEDAETGEQIFLDTADPAFQGRLRAAAGERQKQLRATVRRCGVDLFTVMTDEDLVTALVRISQTRRRRRA